jgi:hypothetical protein
MPGLTPTLPGIPTMATQNVSVVFNVSDCQLANTTLPADCSWFMLSWCTASHSRSTIQSLHRLGRRLSSSSSSSSSNSAELVDAAPQLSTSCLVTVCD